jgi:uncharacterized protein YueI
MTKQDVDEYLQQGIYGQKEIKPEERRKYLGTLRERVVAVLYQSQVLETQVYSEITQQIKQHPKAIMFLNGHINYSNLVKYVKLASSYNIRYKIVLNEDHNTDLGLVLAEEFAIDQENIYIEKKNKVVKINPEKSLWGRVLNFFKK